MLALSVSTTPPTWAGIITAFATVITALGLFVTALSVFLPILRQTRETEKKVEVVHQIVNQQRTDMERYQRALIAQLRGEGMTPVADQSIEAAPGTTVEPPQSHH
jgi:hypothetical protein